MPLVAVAAALRVAVGFDGPPSSPHRQELVVTTGGNRWAFVNGGDRVRLPSGRVIALSRPVLLTLGDHYFPAADVYTVFGLDATAVPACSAGVTRVCPPAHVRSVADYQVLCDVLVTTRPVQVCRSLFTPNAIRTILPGETLLIRRSATVDGVRSVIVTECGPGLESYLVPVEDLAGSTEPGRAEGTTWQGVRRWFHRRTDEGAALRYGSRRSLTRSVCLTVDLCWSLRPLDPDLIGLICETAAARGRPVPVALFVSGRWVEQHPDEMSTLVALATNGAADVTWGLHSWEHPKTPTGMTEWTAARIRQDTTRLEQLLLSWGIVPTVYYRFPNLVHDRERLGAILALDLLPIDCDSWLAVRDRARGTVRGELFGRLPAAGSVLLVHGNGNEPVGIRLLREWLDAHADWAFRSLPAVVASVLDEPPSLPGWA